MLSFHLLILISLLTSLNTTGERQQALGINKAAQGFLGFAELDTSPPAFERSSTFSSPSVPINVPLSSEESNLRLRSDTSKPDRERKRDIFKKKLSSKHMKREVVPSVVSEPLSTSPAAKGPHQISSSPHPPPLSPPLSQSHSPNLGPTSSSVLAMSVPKVTTGSDVPKASVLTGVKMSQLKKKKEPVSGSGGGHEIVAMVAKEGGETPLYCGRCGVLPSEKVEGGSHLGSEEFSSCIVCHVIFCGRCSLLPPTKNACVSGSFHTLERFDLCKMKKEKEKEVEVEREKEKEREKEGVSFFFESKWSGDRTSQDLSKYKVSGGRKEEEAAGGGGAASSITSRSALRVISPKKEQEPQGV